MGDAKELTARIAEHKYGGLYFFFGEEDYLADHHIGRFKSALKDESDFRSFTQFDFSAMDFCDAVLAVPFASDFTLTLVTSFDEINVNGADSKRIADILSYMPETSTVIFKASENKGKAAKKSPQKSARKKTSSPSDVNFTDFISQNAELYEFKYGTKQQLARWIRKIAAQYQTSISDQTAYLLTERCGFSMYAIKNCTDRICAFVRADGRTEINTSDVEYLTEKSSETAAFALTNALLAQNAAQALDVLHNQRIRREDPIYISATIAAHFCDIYSVFCAMQQVGAADYALLSKLCGVHEYRVRLMKTLLAKLTDPQKYVKTALRLCSECDLALKSTSMPPFSVLENLICGINSIE